MEQTRYNLAGPDGLPFGDPALIFMRREFIKEEVWDIPWDTDHHTYRAVLVIDLGRGRTNVNLPSSNPESSSKISTSWEYVNNLIGTTAGIRYPLIPAGDKL